MTDKQKINDNTLDQEARDIAKAILADHPDSDMGDLYAEAHEYVDAHRWTFMTYEAIQVCANCDVSDGEAFLQEVGPPDPVTFGGMACTIAYGELLRRVERELDELAKAREEDEGEESEEDEDDEWLYARAARKAGWERVGHNGYFKPPLGHDLRLVEYDSWRELCEENGIVPIGRR